MRVKIATEHCFKKKKVNKKNKHVKKNKLNVKKK